MKVWMGNAPGLRSTANQGLTLEVRDPNGTHRRITLGQPPLVIGRSAEAQIRLDSSAVSRQHSELAVDAEGRWHIRDLGSRNGTRVNGHVVKDQILAPGDQLEIGNFLLSLLLPTDGPARGPDLAPFLHPVQGTRTGVILSDAGGHFSTLNDLESPKVAAAHLTTLNELSQKFMLSPDPRERALTLCRMMVSPPFFGQWAMLLRLSRKHPEQAPEPLCDPQCASMDYRPNQTPYVSRSLLRAVAHKSQAVLASNSPGGAAGPMAGNIEMSISPHVMTLAAIACPLRQDDQTLDLLYVTLPPQYGSGEWLALTSLAAKQYQQAEAAWHARKQAEAHAALEQELDRARAIQFGLVPQKRALDKHRAAGLDVAIGFVPSQSVGGDYADVLAMKDGRMLLTVADVCGHGLAAAMVTASVHTLVHAGVRAGLNLQNLVEGINEHLCETLPGDSFVTMIAVAVDLETGALQCINAGHPAPLVIGADGQVRELQSEENLPLGVDALQLEVQIGQLDLGELLTLYSDGLSEQLDETEKMLETAGLMAKIREICAASTLCADAAALELSRMLDQRQGGRPAQDDRTFLLARRLNA